MKTVYRILTFLAVLAAIFYLIGAFHQGTFNSSQWTNKDMMVMTYGFMASVGAIGFVLAADKSNKEKPND